MDDVRVTAAHHLVGDMGTVASLGVMGFGSLDHRHPVWLAFPRRARQRSDVKKLPSGTRSSGWRSGTGWPTGWVLSSCPVAGLQHADGEVSVEHRLPSRLPCPGIGL